MTSGTFTTVRAIRALESLVQGPATAAELARSLEIHPRTARRLLLALVSTGWVEHVEGRYRVTDHLLIVALVHSAQRHGLALTPKTGPNGPKIGDFGP